MKIFITGATGYIGNRLALNLAEQGYIVNILVRNLNSINIPVHPNIVFYKGDVNDEESIKTALKDCEYVYHVAAYARLSSRNADIFYRINVEGTQNVLRQALNAGVKKVVFTSSVAVLGSSLRYPLTENDPRIKTFENDYELTKSLAENLVKEYNTKGLPGVIVTLPRVYGPGYGVYSNGVNKFISWALTKKRIIVPSRQTNEANYVFIDDVLKGHQLAMLKGLPGEKYIIGGENASYKKLFSTILELTGQRTKLIKIPYKLVKAGSYLAYLYAKITAKDHSVSPKILDSLFTNRAVSCQKAIDQLGYTITPLHIGIQKTIEYLKK
ncbi:MAG: NAD-dependent epimerase/dehydratase family protein [Daejeonella sp.]